MSDLVAIMTTLNVKPTVLVVNDDEGGRHLIARVLERHFNVEEAATGAAGVEKSLSKPDLVLLDVNLPDISGFEVCKRIKKNPLTRHIPVMHLSASVLDGASRATGLENGADGFLTLPVESAVLVATIHSILRIKRAENALAASNAHLATISKIDKIFLSTSGEETWKALLTEVLYLFSSAGGALGYLNERGEMVLGAVIGAGWDKYEDYACAKAMRSATIVVNNEPPGGERPGWPPGLERFLSMPFMDGGRPVGYITLANKAQPYTSEDVSSAQLLSGHIAALYKGRLDMKRQEARNLNMVLEMANMQKIESLGQLAGGIAHDFNNILTGITGNLSVLKANGGLCEEVRLNIEDTLAATESARKITQQLIVFAKGGRPVKSVFGFGAALASWCSFAMRGSNSKIELSIPPDLWPVNGDECQLNQAVNNLLRNAREAMPLGGDMKVTAGNIENEPARGLALPAGKYVKLSVADNGVGIPAKYLDRIFEPYFTTKEQGHGLGLPMVNSIIKNHGGYIKVDSRPDSGTEFTVYLPAAPGAKPVRIETPGEVRKGSGRVLVMDDDEIIQRAVTRMLTSLGYTCACAGNGEEALRLYKEAGGTSGSFKVVIMDLTIPGGMGGIETMKKLLESDPQAKVVVSSGYSDDNVMGEYKACGFSAALMKPYKYAELADVLAKLIAG